jgi:predicted kinase
MKSQISQETSTRPTLILFCGLPGSGKTTLGRQLEIERPAVRLCPDEWVADLGIDFFDEAFRTRLEHRLWRLGQELLKRGQSIILENGFWSRAEREDLRREINDLAVETEMHYFDVSFEELMRRVEIRNVSGVHGTVPLSRVQMEGYKKLFQAPDRAELALYNRAIVHRPNERRDGDIDER